MRLEDDQGFYRKAVIVGISAISYGLERRVEKAARFAGCCS